MSYHDCLERVAMLDKLVIRHRELEHAVLGIDDCLSKTLVFKEPIGSLLIAEGGMGKTTICQSFLARMPKSIKLDAKVSKTIVPAFYASVPSPATVKSVAASLLASLNDPSPLAGTTAHMTSRLCHLLAECETKLVFLDEFHHLFDIRKTSTHVNMQVCNWIKSLVNSAKVSFCLVGLPNFAPILSIDSQLARRFPFHFQLNALSVGDMKNPGSLVLFLAEMQRQAKHRLELTAMPELNSIFIATKIYAATRGNPAFIMSLIKASVLMAIRVGRNSVTLDDFAEAWDTGVTVHASLTRDNPFRMSEGTLATCLRVRP